MPADLFPEQKLHVGVGVASWQAVPWLSDSIAPAGTALPRALLALQSSWGMRAHSTGEERMWVTAGSPPAGMLRGRHQGECIREQPRFFLGSLLWSFFRDQEKKRCCWREAALLHHGLGEEPSGRLRSAAESRKKRAPGGWQGEE